MCHFNIEDSIVVGPDDELAAATTGEDFFFSRVGDEAGARMGFTTCVAVHH
ncbi:MAG: hypothetical protein R3C10_04055 [Pirellulales bacterium]